MAGTVATVNPLTIATQDGRRVTVVLAQNTRFTRTLPATFKDLKVNEQLIAFGERNQQGQLVAQTLRLGENFQFGGFGGFGGRGGNRGGNNN